MLVVFAEGQSYNLTQLALKKSFTTKVYLPDKTFYGLDAFWFIPFSFRQITTQTDVIKPFETVNGAKVFSLTSVVSSSVVRSTNGCSFF